MTTRVEETSKPQVLVLINVSIAIVSDSYDTAMATADELFYRARLEYISETASLYSGYFPAWLKPSEEAVKRALEAALDDAKDDGSSDTGRIQDIVRRVRGAVDNSTKRAQRDTDASISEMRKEIAELKAMLQQVLAAKGIEASSG